MGKDHKISLVTAILINMSIMFGTGIFINTVNLAKLVGALGFLSYIIIALLVLPLMLCIAALIHQHPEGGFYAYGSKNLSPYAGFLSAWAYFVGKLGSAAVLVHVFSSLIQTLIPSLHAIPTLLIDSIIIIFFAWLNMFNVKTSGRIMYFFLTMKLFPVVFAILSCFYLIHSWTIPAETLRFEGIIPSLPLVLFAFIGFEACCSISKSIINAKKNGPKAIFYSFIFVITITTLYQWVMFNAIGLQLMVKKNFLEIFPTLVHTLFPFSEAFANHLINILHIATATAALGGGYAILFSNHWNLHILAQHNHTFAKKRLTALNKHYIPYMGIVVEAIICIAYLLLTKGNQIDLQQMSVLGCTIAYTISVLALLKSKINKQPIATSGLVVYLGLASCLLLIISSLRNFALLGLLPLYYMLILLVFGSLMFLFKQKNHSL